MKIKNLLLATFAIVASTITVNAQKTLVDVAVGSKDHTTLVAAVKAADLVATLQSAGPFTVFAPVNAAFGKLPAGTVEYLLKPENKANRMQMNFFLGFELAAKITLINKDKDPKFKKQVNGNFF